MDHAGAEAQPTTYTAQEAADALQCSRPAITQAIREGKLTATRFGNAWQITAADLERYRRQRRPPGFQPGHPRYPPPKPPAET